MNVSIRQLKYFLAVVRENSFSRATDACFISQSAISQQIHALETALGCELFARSNRRFSLTPAGEHFYRKALVLVADFDSARAETVRIAQGDASALSIGYLRTYSGCEFHRAIDRFAAEHPDVALSVAYGNHEELYAMLRSGSADVVFNDQRRAFSEEYFNLVFAERPLELELSVHSPHAVLTRATAQEMKNTPCILVSSAGEQAHERAYYQDVVGFSGEFAFAESLESARMMVLGGKGFLPVCGGCACSGLTARVPLVRDSEPVRATLCAFWKRHGASAHAESFAELLKTQFE